MMTMYRGLVKSNRLFRLTSLNHTFTTTPTKTDTLLEPLDTTSSQTLRLTLRSRSLLISQQLGLTTLTEDEQSRLAVTEHQLAFETLTPSTSLVGKSRSDRRREKRMGGKKMKMKETSGSEESKSRRLKLHWNRVKKSQSCRISMNETLTQLRRSYLEQIKSQPKLESEEDVHEGFEEEEEVSKFKSQRQENLHPGVNALQCLPQLNRIQVGIPHPSLSELESDPSLTGFNEFSTLYLPTLLFCNPQVSFSTLFNTSEAYIKLSQSTQSEEDQTYLVQSTDTSSSLLLISLGLSPTSPISPTDHRRNLPINT